MRYDLFSDGGARGNPGPAGIGAILYDQTGAVILTVCEYIGVATNNQAEYIALLSGVKGAHSLGVKNLVCHADSELIIRQIKGEYKVKNQELRLLHDAVMALIGDFESIEFVHVPRENNSFADRLVNRAIDTQEKIVGDF